MRRFVEAFIGVGMFLCIALVFAGTIMAWGMVYGEGLYIHACSKTTCKSVEVAGSATDQAVKGVTLIGDSTDCPETCSVVHSNRGEMHAFGNWMDLYCRAWGGWHCGWDRVHFTPAMLKHLRSEMAK